MKNSLKITNQVLISIVIFVVFYLFVVVSNQMQGRMTQQAGTGGRSLSEVLMDVGRSAENAFYSFLELVSDALGFTVTKDTKKQDVGNYYKKLAEGIEKAIGELSAISGQTDQSDKQSGKEGNESELNKSIDSAKGVLESLKINVESLKGIGDVNVVGHAHNAQGVGTAAADVELKKSLKALQEIVKAAKGAGVPEPKGGNTTLKVGDADNKEGAKILSTSGNNPGAGDAGKAAAILATVSGNEMLDSIVKSKEGDADTGVGGNADGDTSAVSFAKGGSSNNLSNADTPKAAAVSGGIALRSLVKGGKLASGAGDNATGGGKEVQGVGITAANKLLVAVEDIIKKTIKNVLEKVKQEVDKARAPKATGQ
ncbi:Variable large protein A70 (plasmid) [Borrelia hermsii]|uniref:Variable large protein n=1 Tax=Borrelia hermsii TaxID=140 RepID=A0AAN0X6H8_BORHE|nr:Variable large protein A70 [Borrelia hermsii]